jgi:hypothetical protein
VVDCTHIREAKRALERRGGVQKLSGSLFSNEQLDRALSNVGGSGLGGAAQHETKGAIVRIELEGRPSFSQQGGGGAADARLEQYLEELIVGGHQKAACKGDSCFCKQHARIFGGVNLDRDSECKARCCSSASASGKRTRSGQAETMVRGMPPAKGKRRTKEYWAAKEEVRSARGSGPASETGSAANGGSTGGSAGEHEPFLIPVCSSCQCPSSTCTHGEPVRVAAVKPMEAEGVQVEVPKLVRPTDAWETHDPEVTLLRRPVRVNELTDWDFQELSSLECLSATCPRAPPPCGTTWSGLWQTAQIYSLQWSEEVRCCSRSSATNLAAMGLIAHLVLCPQCAAP